MRKHLFTTTTLLALALCGSAHAGMDEAKAFLDNEIKGLSALSRADQEKEMQWFIDAAKPFAGMEIKVVSETIPTHEYESKLLAAEFAKITGIKVTLSKSCRRRCSPAKTSMTPTSTTPT